MSKTVYLGSTLPLERGQRGYFQTTTDPLDNEQSKFINLILTRKGERPGNPNFGCDLWRLLFEPKDDDLQPQAEQAIREAVNNFMGYLELEEISLVNPTTYATDNSLRLYVRYRLAGDPNAIQTEIEALLTEENGVVTVGGVSSRRFLPSAGRGGQPNLRGVVSPTPESTFFDAFA